MIGSPREIMDPPFSYIKSCEFSSTPNHGRCRKYEMTKSHQMYSRALSKAVHEQLYKNEKIAATFSDFIVL